MKTSQLVPIYDPVGDEPSTISEWIYTTSTAISAISGNGYALGAEDDVDITLPSTPSNGDLIGVSDVHSRATSYTFKVLRNGNNINGVAEDFTIDVNGWGAAFMFVTGYGWKVVFFTAPSISVPTIYICKGTFDGGGYPIQANNTTILDSATKGNIVGWTILTKPDTSGSIELAVYKQSYANYAVPVAGDSITGGNNPTLTNAIKNRDTTLTGWTKTVLQGDIFIVKVVSSTVSWAVFKLEIAS